MIALSALRTRTAAIAARGARDRIPRTDTGRRNPAEARMAAMDTWRIAFRGEGLPNRLPEAESLGLPVVAPLTGSSGQDDATISLAVIRIRGSQRRASAGVPALIERRWGIARMIRETPAASGETDPTGMGIPS